MRNSSMEADGEHVPLSSDVSDSGDEFTGEREEEEEQNDDDGRTTVKSLTSDEDRKSRDVDALLRSV